MSKTLSEMSLSELWALFPICLTPPDPLWPEFYTEESAELTAALPSAGIVLNHIGSTAVHGICAKPIIDLLLECAGRHVFDDVRGCLPSCGYRCMNESDSRADYNKGYTESGFAERVFHLHLRLSGDNDELYFRDYLIEHPDTAKMYERLKLSLWRQFEHDRDGYTRAKTDFVTRYTKQARQLYAGRYSR